MAPRYAFMAVGGTYDPHDFFYDEMKWGCDVPWSEERVFKWTFVKRVDLEQVLDQLQSSKARRVLNASKIKKARIALDAFRHYDDIAQTLTVQAKEFYEDNPSVPRCMHCMGKNVDQNSFEGSRHECGGSWQIDLSVRAGSKRLRLGPGSRILYDETGFCQT